MSPSPRAVRRPQAAAGPRVPDRVSDERAPEADRAGRGRRDGADDRSRSDVPWWFGSSSCPPTPSWARLPARSGSGSGTRRPSSSSSTRLVVPRARRCGRVFEGAALFVLIAALASALVVLVVLAGHPSRPRAGRPWCLVLVASCSPALVMYAVGSGSGRRTRRSRRLKADGTRLHDHLQGAGLTPLLVGRDVALRGGRSPSSPGRPPRGRHWRRSGRYVLWGSRGVAKARRG